MTPAKQRRSGLRKLARARHYLAEKYCVAYGVGFGTWTRLSAKAAYALLSDLMKKL